MTSTPDDLARPDDTVEQVARANLRLMAGTVSKRTMEQLQRTLQQNPSEFPWQVVTQVLLAEPVDEQRLVQQALVAQRDWIVRGGRETPRPSVSHRAKGLLARICAQLIFAAIFTLVLVLILLLLEHLNPALDLSRVLHWFRSTFGIAPR
jgi:hypothetical protein